MGAIAFIVFMVVALKHKNEGIGDDTNQIIDMVGSRSTGPWSVTVDELSVVTGGEFLKSATEAS